VSNIHFNKNRSEWQYATKHGYNCRLHKPTIHDNSHTNTIRDLYSAAIQIVQGRWQSYEKVSVNKWDFKLCLNIRVSDRALRCGGRQFNAAGLAWLKPHLPNFVPVVCLTHLALSVDFKHQRLAEEADCTLSTRYCGAQPMWIWCISKPSLPETSNSMYATSQKFNAGVKVFLVFSLISVSTAAVNF